MNCRLSCQKLRILDPMKTASLLPGETHLLKLDRGEKLLESILAYVEKSGITAGKVSGIGALSVAKVAFFDPKEKAYHESTFHDVELVSCQGNISIKGDTREPVAHLHVGLSDSNGTMYGGHLNKGSIVSVTAEILITTYRGAILRSFDPAVGLCLIDTTSEKSID